MNLLELLNTNLPYKIIRANNTTFIATFEANGRTIKFDAGQMDDVTDDWDITFFEIRANGNETTSITKSGKEFEVFGTVKSLIEEVIKRYHPKIISFVASKHTGEGSRAKLYTALVKKFKAPGYKVHVENPELASSAYYSLERT